MQTFPAFFPLAGRRIVVAGEGAAADAKARLFDGSPAELVRLRGEPALDVASYVGAALAFVADASEAFVQAAAVAARSAHVPVNVVDHPALCDFQTPAIVDRDQVVAAVGTAGAAPVMASLLRAEIEARISPAVGALARLLAERREAIRAAFPDLAARRALFRRILAGPAPRAAEAGDMAGAARAIERALEDNGVSPGRIVFILAPAEPDQLSLRAVRALNIADAVVIAGEDTHGLVAGHARRDVERLGRANADDLAERAAAGLTIAVLAVSASEALLRELAARGVGVDVHAPAP